MAIASSVPGSVSIRIARGAAWLETAPADSAATPIRSPAIARFISHDEGFREVRVS